MVSSGRGGGDMPRLLMEAADATRPVYDNEAGFSLEEAAQYMAGELNTAYLQLAGVRESARNQSALSVSARRYRKIQAY